MQKIQDIIGGDVYVITPSATSQAIDISAVDYGDNAYAILSNNSDKPVFVTLGDGASAPTVVFPTSSVKQKGKVIMPGSTQSFSINKQANFIGVIQATAGVGDLYVCIGEGI